MKSKMTILSLSIIIAGIIITIIGLYYYFFMAGLPYVDPTTEMTIRWMAYDMAGKMCLKSGVLFILLGSVCKVVSKFTK